MAWPTHRECTQSYTMADVIARGRYLLCIIGDYWRFKAGLVSSCLTPYSCSCVQAREANDDAGIFRTPHTETILARLAPNWLECTSLRGLVGDLAHQSEATPSKQCPRPAQLPYVLANPPLANPSLPSHTHSTSKTAAYKNNTRHTSCQIRGNGGRLDVQAVSTAVCHSARCHARTVFHQDSHSGALYVNVVVMTTYDNGSTSCPRFL